MYQEAKRLSVDVVFMFMQSEVKMPSLCFCSLPLQLFRRVAAALPGMESIQETSKVGSIL